MVLRRFVSFFALGRWLLVGILRAPVLGNFFETIQLLSSYHPVIILFCMKSFGNL
jgi:hypothetical protein